MNLFKWLKPKKQKQQGPTRRPMYDICEETLGIVGGIAEMLRDMAEQKSSGKKPQEQEQQGEGWEPFVAYSPMIDSLGQEITETEGEETIDYAEYALITEYAAEIAAVDGGSATGE